MCVESRLNKESLYRTTLRSYQSFGSVSEEKIVLIEVKLET